MMKKFTITLCVTTIAFLVIIAASFSYVVNVPIKDTLVAQYHAIMDKGHALINANQEAENQYASTKPDNYSVAKANGLSQGDPNSIDPMVHRGKLYLLKHVDNRIRQLGRFRDKMQNMAVALNNSEMKAAVTGLNADIAAFEALKAEINRSATKEDIKTVADKVKATWIKNRLSVDHAKELALVSKETQLVSDADSASTSMQKRIKSLKAAGKDAKPFEKMLADYNKKLASAKQDMKAANEKLKAVANAVTDDEKQKLIKGNALLLANSRENIRDAYKLVADAARKDFARRIQ
jgi:hypothetical protein